LYTLISGCERERVVCAKIGLGDKVSSRSDVSAVTDFR